MPVIDIPTKWGALPAKYHYSFHSTTANHLAVLFPGRGYTLDAPLMWYAEQAALHAGCDVIGVEYGYQANRSQLDMDELDSMIGEVADALNRIVTRSYANVVFIGKSLGTIVQTEVSSKVHFFVRNHIFLTPLRPIISAICASENSLVVVGDNDGAFTAADIVQITDLPNVKINVLPGADHSLEAKDYTESIDILKQVAKLCGDFCQPSM